MSVSYLDILGSTVREMREARGYSQERLAERADLHRTYLGGLERGERNPTVVVLLRLAEALNISLGELFAAIEAKD